MNNSFLGEILSDPEVMAQVEPLLSAAIDARLSPINEKLEQLAQGVTLLAQAHVEAAQGQQPQPQPVQAQPQAQQFAGPQQLPQQQTGFAPQAYGPPVGAPAPSGGDKLAAFAPLLMQYLQTQQNGTGSQSLAGVADTLGIAASIGNAMNAPMYQGMRMATELMALAGRAGIEPVTAAETLGGMVDNATTPKPAANGTNSPG